MTKRALSIRVLAILVLVLESPALAGAAASFRYALSNFSGPVPSQWAQLAIDRERNEIYALNQRQNDIRVFDEHGMEIFVFGDGFAAASDITIGTDGSIFILSAGHQSASVDRFDYRGGHVSAITLKNMPEAFSEFVPDRIVYGHRSLYLVDSDSLLVVVTDEQGYFKEGHDLGVLLRPFLTRARKQRELDNVDWKQKKLEFVELNGFTVDDRGNMYFTLPVLFAAYKLSPNGEMKQFGRPGSAPGKFGVAAGIATDELGYVYVADRLRSVVLVFDADLRFETEFGYRGDEPSNLIVPDDLAVDRSGNVYVAQAANRGVSVFTVVRESRSPFRGSESISTVPEKSDHDVQAVERTGRTIEGSEFVDMEESGDDE